MSLTEQRDAINRYCARYALGISQWFEERETAAKRGRTVFTHMLRLLRKDVAQGVVIHKIDRSARNLKDWADLGELIDAGVEVHFANESLDLNTRGGRLSADIQAVVASDYIRNLREETRKGFYGRLKQGIYPMGAPVGYLDRGGGKVKEPDTTQAALIVEAFRLYDSGNYSLPRLKLEMHARGLRNRAGGIVSLNGLSTILNNPFYIGVIRIRKTGEVFLGAHEPIIAKALFDRVHARLRGKTVARVVEHDFTFRKLIRCRLCSYNLIGELQKNHVYYRCHTPACPTKTVREERIEEAVAGAFHAFTLDEEEIANAQKWLATSRADCTSLRAQELEACRLRLDQLKSRMNRTTDAYLDGILDKSLFDERKAALIAEEAGLKQRITAVEEGSTDPLSAVQEFLELLKTASTLYSQAISAEKREMVRKLTSNVSIAYKNVVVTLTNGAQLVAQRQSFPSGSPQRGIART